MRPLSFISPSSCPLACAWQRRLPRPPPPASPGTPPTPHPTKQASRGPRARGPPPPASPGTPPTSRGRERAMPLVVIFFFLFLLVQSRLVAEVDVGILVFGDLVHAFIVFQIQAGAAGDRLLVEVLLVGGEGAGVRDDQPLPCVRPVLDLAPADDREARLALELGVLVRLTDDHFDSAALAGGDAGLVAVATLDELDQAARELGFQAANPHTADGVHLDAVTVDAQ